MKLGELEDLYHRGVITKREYIAQMYEIHDVLHDYTAFMQNRDVKKIEISDDTLIMTSRSLDLQFICPRFDERIAPIEILNFRDYEETDTQMIFSLVKQGDVAFDIGANIGWYAMSMAKLGAAVYAFEPIPTTYELLAKNVAINHLDNAHVFNVGVSNEERELTFYYYPEGSVNASSAVLNDQVESQQIVCKVKRLDDIVSELCVDRLDFIKCDVEGAELFVFQGGLDTIRHYHPIIYTEMLRKWSARFDYHPNAIIELFRSLDYRCFTATKGGLVEFHEMNEETTETNFFFLHASKHRQIIAQCVIH